MSFILDALQKSETERHGQRLPSLADVPIRPRRAERPWWIFAVAGLLFVNLAVLAVVLLRDSKTPDSPTPESQAAATANTVPATDAPPRRRVRVLRDTSEAGREFAEQAGAMMADDPSSLPASFDPAAGPEQMQAAASVPQGQPMVQPIEGPRVEPPRGAFGGSAVPPPAAAAAVPPASTVPSIDELTAKGMVLPNLHIDLHVYAPTPAGRFVFINKQKYTEGQSLREGFVVVQITPDGVELDNGNARFMLPRQ